MTTWWEPFAGSAPTALRLLSPALAPFAPYLGSKRRWAPNILAVAGLRAGSRPDVYLTDVGPWGGAWARLAAKPARALRVADALDGWASRDPVALFDELAAVPPYPDADLALAQWLWLQTRSLNHLPVWWDARRRAWLMGDKPRNGPSKPLRQRGTWKPAPTRAAGCRRTGTIARRLRAFAREVAPGEVRAKRCDALALPGVPEDLREWVCFLDPPYRGCASYKRAIARTRLVRFALALRERGARVLVAERELVAELDGWAGVRLAPGEWLTCSFAPLWRPPEQLPLTPELVTPADAPRLPRPRVPRPPPPVPEPAGEQVSLFPGVPACP